jgi:SAM-dependent methyltransferase
MSHVQASDSRYIGSVPELYHRCLGPVMFEPYAEELASRLELPNDGRLLEVACGTGIATRRLLGALPPGARFVATDLNEPMLTRARAHVPADPRLTFAVADAQALPFDAATFDALVCQFGMMFLPDKPRALREFRRVLKPGGRLLFSVWGTLDDNPYARIAHQAVGRFFPSDPPTFFATTFGWNDPAVIRDMLTAAGFSDVAIAAVDKVGIAPSASNFAAGLVRGYPIAIVLQERGIANVESVETAVAEALAAELGAAPCRAPERALMTEARNVVRSE